MGSITVSRGADCRGTAHSRSWRRSSRPTGNEEPTLEAHSGPGGAREDDEAPMQQLTDRTIMERA
jgi:hypothetical protein